MRQGKTRIIHLDGGQLREDAENTRTRVAVFDLPPAADAFRELFTRNYSSIRRKCSSFGYPGVAIIAIDTYSGNITGSLCVAAKVGSANSAVIGRHSMTDLYLEGDKSLSLRHLLLVLAPIDGSRGDVRFRVIDLRTSTAFQDEHGLRYEGLMAEGPVFVRCSHFALFFLLTGESGDWPESAADGWACIPERVYIEEAEAEPDRWRRHLQKRVAPTHAGIPGVDDHSDAKIQVTHVTSVRGPVRESTRMLTPGEIPLGTLRISTDEGVQRLVVGPTALQQGVLIGRYDRCDVDGTSLLTHVSISRVHLLVIEVGGTVYAIDTASTNGTWMRDSEREVRLSALTDGMELILGNERAYVRWILTS